MAGENDLSIRRTFLAHERTLMAWIRTSTSLISFGFATYKFFEYLKEAEPVKPYPHLLGPREFALIMISLGVIALVIAAIQNVRTMKEMRENFGEMHRSLAGGLAIVLSVIGIVFLTVVWFRK
jgi:putative membrane protein